jgi:hypothetical protein
MAKRIEDIEADPAIVVIGDVEPEGTFDDWLASIHGDGRVELPLPASHYVGEARSESGW